MANAATKGRDQRDGKTDAPAPSTGTAVATEDDAAKRRAARLAALPPEHQRAIAERREKANIAQAIRGTQWGKSDLSELQISALASYCIRNGLDAVRHVEVLGGKVYLTAEFYDERGADLILNGDVIPLPPDFIHADARLAELAKGDGDMADWAAAEHKRRLKLRIMNGVPEAATGACIWTFKLKASDAPITGVNWCGGQTRKKMVSGGTVTTTNVDPIGDMEPVKTAETRSRRRAWRKIAKVVPAYGARVLSIELEARTVLPVAVVEAPDNSLAPGNSAMPNTGDEVAYIGAGSPTTETAAPATTDDRTDDDGGELALNDRRPRD